MVPAGEITDKTIQTLAEVLEPGDIIIDGGNTHYHDDIRHASRAAREGHPPRRLRHERRRLGSRARLLPDDRRREGGRRPPLPALRVDRPGRRGRRARRLVAPASPSPSEQGYLHCGPNGAGHFVKMVHNGIEYGLMAAYAEGLNILKNAERGQAQREADAETTPARAPRVLPVRDRHDRGGRGLAARQRRRLVAPRPYRRGALRIAASSRSSPAASPTPAKAAGHRWPRSRRASPRRSSPPPSTRGSARAASTTSPTGVLSAMRKEFGGHDEKTS